MKDRVPVGEALAGLTLHPLPDGWTALTCIVLVKCLDDKGHPSWAFRTAGGMNDEELLGALTVRTDILRRRLLQDYGA
jgi:hypothetical protein